MQIEMNVVDLDYVRVVRAYKAGEMNEAEFWEAMLALGYDYAETEWHLAWPGRMMRTGVAA